MCKRSRIPLNVVIDNTMQELPVDEVEVQLSGRDSNKVVFSAKVSGIVPGNNELTLFCPVSTCTLPRNIM